MPAPIPPPRPAFTLLELLVVIGIVAVLLGLLLPAVQKVREAANRAACANNLKQLTLAFHDADRVRGRLPPGIGYYVAGAAPTGPAYGTAAYHLLPYLEQSNLYNLSAVNGSWYAWNNDVQSHKVAVFLCPSDPTSGTGVVPDLSGKSWGACTYAGNAQVFCTVAADGALINTEGHPTLSASFLDGTSNTILIAEKYARCSNLDFPEGGSFWAYWVTGFSVQPLHPAFAISWTTYSVGPGSRFQLRPPPDNCDPSLASTPHPGGIVVGMADGSVRSISVGISGETWWAVCTPNGGEVPGSDWN